MAQESPSRDQDKFMVRMPEGMRDRIAEAAKANNRSMNAEIVARLEASLDRDSGSPGGIDVYRELLTDRVFASFEIEQQAELDSINTSTTKGMVKWLDAVHKFNVKEKQLQEMIDEAVRLHKAKLQEP